MFFLIGFVWHVAASFAFVLAVLSPNWLTLQTYSSTLGNVTIQRGIFYVCNVIPTSAPYQTTQCASIIGLNASINSTGIWHYNLATSSASIAIGCGGLSIIVLWLSGIYFNVRKKDSCTSCFLLSTCLLLLLTLSASCAVWILMITETLVLGYSVDRSIFNWPIWLSVGASGGYLMALVTLVSSFCIVVCNRRKRDKHLYMPRDQF